MKAECCIKNMLLKAKAFYNFATDKYFVEGTYMQAASADEIPVGLAHWYVQYNNGKAVFVKDISQATCFDSILGLLVVKALKDQVGTDKSIDFSLVSTASALFIEDITT